MNATKSDGDRAYADLVSLRDGAGEKHYLRVKKADELLRNREWVEAADGGGGDEDKAIGRLEANAFPDLVGAVSLVQLLEVLHHYPDIHTWRRHKFNFRSMWACVQKAKPQRPKAPPVKRADVAVKTPAEVAQMTPAEARKEYAKVVRVVENDAAKIGRLEKENADLKKKVAALERLVVELGGDPTHAGAYYGATA